MKRRFTISLMLVAVAVAFAFVAAPNFSGEWTFNESKSDLGDAQFRFVWETLKITHTGNTITIVKHGESQNGPFDQEEKLTLDGKASENPFFGDNVRKSTVTWSGETMVVTSEATLNFNGESNSFSQKESYSLDASGKVLTVVNETSSSFGDSKQKIVYEKK